MEPSTIPASSCPEQAFEKMEEAGVPKASQPSTAAEPSPEQKAESKEQQLPKLSAQEFRIYNSMAEHMDMFHNNFRQTWNTLYSACVSNTRPSGLSIRQFLALIGQFCHHLTIHHTIEEQHIFPVLAKKMKFFNPKEHALKQHQGIHDGVEALEKWVQEVKEGLREFQLKELKVVMDGFGQVLWAHLEDEVRELGAENMRKYWSVQEMRRMPM